MIQKYKCNVCGRVIEAEQGAPYKCPECGALDYRDISDSDIDISLSACEYVEAKLERAKEVVRKILSEGRAHFQEWGLVFRLVKATEDFQDGVMEWRAS